MEKVALSEENIDLKVEEAKKTVTYKTKIEFHDKEKGKRVEVSVVAPAVTPSGTLQFLTESNLISYNMAGVFRWETEQVVHEEPSRLVI